MLALIKHQRYRGNRRNAARRRGESVAAWRSLGAGGWRLWLACGKLGVAGMASRQ
jgi:hypothetical protein